MDDDYKNIFDAINEFKVTVDEICCTATLRRVVLSYIDHQDSMIAELGREVILLREENSFLRKRLSEYEEDGVE